MPTLISYHPFFPPLVVAQSLCERIGLANQPLTETSADSRYGYEAAFATGDGGGSGQQDALIYLRAAVARLPRKQRWAVVLFAIEGYSHWEVAAMTGMTVAASKVQLHLGKRRLRVELER